MGPIRSRGFVRLLLVTAGILLAIYAGYPLAVARDSSPPPEKSLFQMWKSVVAGGGAAVGTAAHRSSGTLGQPLPAGKVSSTHYTLHGGFWAGARMPLSPAPPARSTVLGQNYPNPFNPQTTIPFFTDSEGRVELAVFDARGRLVRVLVSEVYAPGPHRVVWDGKNDRGQQAASGVYFMQLRTDQTTMVKKLLLVK
jgi:hypothetical protein